MVEINPQRLIQSLQRLRGIGTFGTGVIRPAFSPEDMKARRWLCDQMSEAGLQPTMDGVGNVLGRSRNSGKAVLIGSHTDTQPQGGWLDGALGVMYGLEIARAFAEKELTANYPVDVASWSDEEGTYMGLLGSRSFCSMLSSKDMERAHNHQTGVGLTEAITAAGLEGAPSLRLDSSRNFAYLEAHVEQGPHLDAQGLLLGVVTAIVGIRTFRLTFTGEQNHAGTTPMGYRKDAAIGLIKIAHRIDKEFSAMAGPRTVWTIGYVRLEPGSHSVVPGRAEMLLQMRDTDEDVLNNLESMTVRVVKEANERGPVTVTMDASFPWGASTLMDGTIQGHLAAAAESYAPGRWLQMPSGAAHDAQILATRIPSGMLFIPSIGGISHDINEDTTEEDVVRGCRVLAAAAESLFKASGRA